MSPLCKRVKKVMQLIISTQNKSQFLIFGLPLFQIYGIEKKFGKIKRGF